MEILLYVILTITFLSAMIIVLKIIELKNITYKKPEILSDKKILTVYYSNGGNTKNIGEKLHLIVGGDLKEIKLAENYPQNIFTMSNLIRKQIKNGFLPQIQDIDSTNYDIIFVGSPIWGFSISLPIKAFLQNNNFKNKTIIPFFTCSGGVAKNKIAAEVKAISNAKEIKKPLFIFENGIILAKEQIIKWINNI